MWPNLYAGRASSHLIGSYSNAGNPCERSTWPVEKLYSQGQIISPGGAALKNNLFKSIGLYGWHGMC
jgi:hypothetical protein